MALVDQPVGDRLADQVRADGKALQAVALQDSLALTDVGVAFQRLIHLEVVTPAGKLETIVAPGFRFLGQGCDGQIGELSGKEGDWPGHGRLLSSLLFHGTESISPRRRSRRDRWAD